MGKPAAKSSKKKSKMTPMMIALFLVGIVVLQYVFLFIFIAMLPAIVAYIIDTRKGRPIFSTVAALNFAGLFPYLIEIALSNDRLNAASSHMSSVYTWFVIYAAAGLGWAMIILCPIVCGLVLRGIFSGQVMHLESQQLKLVVEWGP